MNTKKVWYITGASKGLGLALAKKLLSEGYRVAATSRTAEQLKNAVGSANEDQFLALEVDLTSDESIKQSIQKTQAHFGQLDVIVNNAGYGIGGSIEELSQEDVYNNFDVNVFATIKVIHHALPILRAQRSGHIINISSIGGFAGATGWSIYAATKFAITGMTEVLAEEVRDLGIKVTVVAPGAFRTEFLSDESLVMANNVIDDYQAIRNSHAKFHTMNGKQAGDPEKAAEAFITLAENPEPPVRLFLGSDAYARASAKITLLGNDLEQWKDLTLSTDFPA
jgi:NAD(P)-dependent dehydrogenase (short-subunit alcohol dehydrogenase family)